MIQEDNDIDDGDDGLDDVVVIDDADDDNNTDVCDAEYDDDDFDAQILVPLCVITADVWRWWCKQKTTKNKTNVCQVMKVLNIFSFIHVTWISQTDTT